MTIMWMRMALGLLWSVLGSVIVPLAQAEFYVEGQVGTQMSTTLGNAQGMGASSGVRFSEVQLKESFVGGLKTGYFFEKLPAIGLEIRASHAAPPLQNQPIASTGGPSGLLTFHRTDLRVVSVGLNLTARMKMGRSEPYLAVGPAIFFAQLKNGVDSTSANNSVVGFNGAAGYRFFPFNSRHVALSAEYNYHRAHLNFDNVLNPALGYGTGLQGTYEAHVIMLGVSYHF